MKLIWFGHAAFRIELSDAVILIDPFFSGNPKFSGSVDAAAEGVTHIVLTHGHDDPFSVSFTRALHSSSTIVNGQAVYLGDANGIIITPKDGPSVYHMGDTDIFSDMALIAEIHAPQIGIVPVGDRFTMSGKTAALAVKRFFNFATVIPCHYGTFDFLAPDANAFVAAMQGHKTKVVVPRIGEVVVF